MAKGDKEVVIKVKVNSEIAKWLRDNAKSRNLSNVTSKAIAFYHDFLYTRKGFFCRLLEVHYKELKHMLRVVGSTRRLLNG